MSDKKLFKIPEELKNEEIVPLKLDPAGYFLIKTEEDQILIGFCRYKEETGWYENTVESSMASHNPEKILQWVNENGYYTQEEHYQYILKELYYAKKCIEKGKKYIQN